MKTESNFVIERLNKAHKKKGFSCGVESLDTYLERQAGQDGRKGVSVTYVLVDEELDIVAGYYTLSATAIEFLSIPEDVRRKLPTYPHLPATLIGRLAIDSRYKGRDLGLGMLSNALKRAHKTSQYVASFAVIVDAINESAKKFYRKYGFLDMSVASNRLYMPMSFIPESLLA